MEEDLQMTKYKLGRTRTFLGLALFALATLVIFDIGNVSFSFVFGAALIFLSLKDYKFFFIPRGLTWFLIIFIAVAYISLVVSEMPATNVTPIRVLQLLYWLLLALFVFNSYEYVDKILLSKTVFFSVITFLILDVTVMSLSQNEVAFSVIIMGPLGYFYLRKYYIKLIYAFVLIFLMLLNGSRTGAILSLVQTILFLIIFTPRIQKYAKAVLLITILLSLSLNITPIRTTLGRLINPINPEVSNLLINPDEVFRNDLSWLQRRAQVNKGLQIFKQHPMFGIGAFNFPRYDIKIDVSNIETDRTRIKGIDNRSAHNAYVDLLSETGIIGFSFIILMFCFAFWQFIKNLNQIGSTFEGCVFISFIGFLIYFYVISGFYGTSAWLMYGLILGASSSLKVNNIA